MFRIVSALRGFVIGGQYRTARQQQRRVSDPSKASSYVEKLGKRFFAHRYFVENLAAMFTMIAQAGGAIFASLATLGLLASLLAHRKRASEQSRKC